MAKEMRLNGVPQDEAVRKLAEATPDEQEAVYNMRKALNGMKSEEAVENILNMFARTRNNGELIQILKKTKNSIRLAIFKIV